MKIKQRIVSFFVISLLAVSIVSIAPIRLDSVKAQQPSASLIGVTSDKGVNPNTEGLYRYLNVTVGINVTEPGYFIVESDYLTDNASNTLSLYAQASGYLNVGTEQLTLSFYGARINHSHLDPYSLGNLLLYTENNTFFPIDQLNAPATSLHLPLLYNYSAFDPVAGLTGEIYDKGLSNPGDSKFDYLEIGVQINVTDAGNYSISIYGLSGSTFNSSWVYYSDYKSGHFTVGLQFVNFSCPGQMIYAAKANVAFVSSIGLMAYMEGGWWSIDQLSDVLLPKAYNYTAFNPHAYLTGKVYDKGVDTDNGGSPFNYLQTSIEVNVTEDGTYQVMVRGLAGNDSSQTYDYLVSNPLNLHEGIHLFNFTFYGPEIAYYGINPRSVTGVSLSELSNSSGFSGQLDYKQSIPLETNFSSSDFDHPQNDMQLNFTVNPDGSVAINALLNATHMYPQNPYDLVVNASARLSKTNNLILGSASGAIGLPPYVTVPWSYPYSQVQFPTNQTTADYLSQYNNGILTKKLNATSVFPPILKTQYPYNTTDFALLGTYANGMIHAQLSCNSTIPQDVASELPFNLTDLTIEANMGSNNEFKGNITVHMIAGLSSMGDLLINFIGNRSDMLFSGNVTVPYVTYDGIVVNATTVAQLISTIKGNITGQGPNSLYNMTNGILECTNIEITNTTIPGGVRIDYSASVHGDFAALIATYVTALYVQYPYPTQSQYYPAIYAALNSTLSSVNDMSFTLVYLQNSKPNALMDISFDSNIKTLWSNALKLIPPTIPSDTIQNETNEINTLLEIGNATACSVQKATLHLAYSSTEPSLVLNATLVVNAAQLNNDTEKLIPNLLSYEYSTSPQMQNIIEAYLNKTYVTLESCNTTIHLKNGIANFNTNFTFEGSLDEQIDAAKSYYINLINYEYSLINAPLPAQLSSLNQTSIDINNLGMYLQYGRDNAFLNVTGIVAFPPTQAMPSSQAFKLTNFFNLTSGYNEPPTEFEKLKIIIHGGSNSTCAVIPQRSGTVPAPSEVSSDGRTFTWENTTISSLRDMIFNQAYQGTYQNGGTTYDVPILSNSTIRNFNFNPKNYTITFSVAGAPGTAGYCNITIPQSLLDISAQSSWIIKENNTQLQAGNIPLQPGHYNVTQNKDYTFIYIAYTHSNHIISITGNVSSVREMPPNLMPFIMMIVSLMATLLIVTQRKKMRRLKAKSLDIVNRMSNRFSQLLKE